MAKYSKSSSKAFSDFNIKPGRLLMRKRATTVRSFFFNIEKLKKNSKSLTKSDDNTDDENVNYDMEKHENKGNSSIHKSLELLLMSSASQISKSSETTTDSDISILPKVSASKIPVLPRSKVKERYDTSVLKENTFPMLSDDKIRDTPFLTVRKKPPSCRLVDKFLSTSLNTLGVFNDLNNSSSGNVEKISVSANLPETSIMSDKNKCQHEVQANEVSIGIISNHGVQNTPSISNNLTTAVRELGSMSTGLFTQEPKDAEKLLKTNERASIGSISNHGVQHTPSVSDNLTTTVLEPGNVNTSLHTQEQKDSEKLLKTNETVCVESISNHEVQHTPSVSDNLTTTVQKPGNANASLHTQKQKDAEKLLKTNERANIGSISNHGVQYTPSVSDNLTTTVQEPGNVNASLHTQEQKDAEKLLKTNETVCVESISNRGVQHTPSVSDNLTTTVQKPGNVNASLHTQEQKDAEKLLKTNERASIGSISNHGVQHTPSVSDNLTTTVQEPGNVNASLHTQEQNDAEKLLKTNERASIGSISNCGIQHTPSISDNLTTAMKELGNMNTDKFSQEQKDAKKLFFKEINLCEEENKILNTPVKNVDINMQYSANNVEKSQSSSPFKENQNSLKRRVRLTKKRKRRRSISSGSTSLEDTDELSSVTDELSSVTDDKKVYSKKHQVLQTNNVKFKSSFINFISDSDLSSTEVSESIADCFNYSIPANDISKTAVTHKKTDVEILEVEHSVGNTHFEKKISDSVMAKDSNKKEKSLDISAVLIDDLNKEALTNMTAYLESLIPPMKRKHFDLPPALQDHLKKKEKEKKFQESLQISFCYDNDKSFMKLLNPKRVKRPRKKPRLEVNEKEVHDQEILKYHNESGKRRVTDLTDLEVAFTVISKIFQEFKDKAQTEEIKSFFTEYENAVTKELTTTIKKAVTLKSKKNSVNKLAKQVKTISKELGDITDRHLSLKQRIADGELRLK